MAEETFVPAQRGSYPPPPAFEAVWPSQLSLLLVIGLQLTLPSRLTFHPSWPLPALEGTVLIGLVFITPRRLEGHHPVRRRIALSLAGLVTLANAFALGALVHYLFKHTLTNGHPLIIAGAVIWGTNVVLFGLWYWELDRGGPGRRAAGEDGEPDFLFPQMTDDRIEPRGWRPAYIDYLYVSLTNASAFSPTDTMPLSPMAKSVMGLQALVSLVTIGLIISRAVNIL